MSVGRVVGATTDQNSQGLSAVTMARLADGVCKFLRKATQRFAQTQEPKILPKTMIVAAAGLLLFFFAAPRLTTAKIEAARATGR